MQALPFLLIHLVVKSALGRANTAKRKGPCKILPIGQAVILHKENFIFGNVTCTDKVRCDQKISDERGGGIVSEGSACLVQDKGWDFRQGQGQSLAQTICFEVICSALPFCFGVIHRTESPIDFAGGQRRFIASAGFVRRIP